MITVIATLKGVFDTSIAILLNTMHKVGETLDISNITNIVPNGIDYTAFFREYVTFCTHNGSKHFRINEIKETLDGYELFVTPI